MKDKVRKTAEEIALLRLAAKGRNVKLYHSETSEYLRKEKKEGGYRDMTPSYLYLAIDLEMNPGSRKVFQLGYVVGDLKKGIILERGNYLINIDEPLCEIDDDEKNLINIVKLTKITNKKLQEEGISLLSGYEKIAGLFDKYEKLNRVPLIWGFDDSAYLFEQLHALHGLERKDYKLAYHSWDVKCSHYDWCVKHGVHQYSNLAASMGKSGLLFKGQAHNPEWDSFNTFSYKWLLGLDLPRDETKKEIMISDDGVMTIKKFEV